MSFVSLEKHICPVCMAEVETDGLLINKQLKGMPNSVVTGYELCQEHKALAANKQIALVAVEYEGQADSKRVKPENVTMHYGYAIISHDLWGQLINLPLPTTTNSVGETMISSMVYVDKGVLAYLRALAAEDGAHVVEDESSTATKH